MSVSASIVLAENSLASIKVAAENAIIVYLKIVNSTSASAQNIAKLARLNQLVNADKSTLFIIRTLVSYQSIYVEFDLLHTDHQQVSQQLLAIAENIEHSEQLSGKQVSLPVYYGEQVAPDLAVIAKHAGISQLEVIKRHSQQSYQVYAIGFAPGFAYLGFVDKKIAMPRHASPRAKVPKGAVGIADRQTAVYPAASPGGWHIVGNCPLTLFNPKSKPKSKNQSFELMPFAVGDTVKFEPIEKQEFIRLGGIFEDVSA